MVISWPRVITVEVLSEYVSKVESTKFVDRADVGYGNKKHILNYCVPMAIGFSKREERQKWYPLPKKYIYVYMYLHINSYANIYLHISL